MIWKPAIIVDNIRAGSSITQYKDDKIRLNAKMVEFKYSDFSEMRNSRIFEGEAIQLDYERFLRYMSFDRKCTHNVL